MRKWMLLMVIVTLVVGFSAGYDSAKASFAQAGTQIPNPDWQISTKNTGEVNKKPDYTIAISQPILQARNAEVFNKAVSDTLNLAITDFKSQAKDAVQVDDNLSSSLTIDYDVLASSKGIISVQFIIAVYIEGAAHPYSVTHSLNYNLQTGKVLTLADIFKPKTKYLDFIAKYCQDELKREKRLTFPDGALAKDENYRNWNIMHGGLLITFDAEQVGSHAEGASEVFIPYVYLGDLLSDNIWFMS